MLNDEWRSVVGWFAPANEWYRYFGIGSGKTYLRLMLRATGWRA